MTYNPVVFYCGDFSPPILGHLNTALSLDKRKEIYQVIVVVGPGKISALVKAELWKILLQNVPSSNISVQISEKEPSLTYVYNKLMKQPDTACYIALDEPSARKSEFAKHFNKFPHVEIELIPSQFGKESKQMLNAINSEDVPTIKSLLPEDIAKEQLDAYISQLKPEEYFEPETSEELKERYSNMFRSDFWNSMLGLNKS